MSTDTEVKEKEKKTPVKRHSKDGFVKNTRASPAEIRIRAERAKKNIGVGGPKKEDKLKAAKEVSGPGLSKWTIAFIAFCVLGSAVVGIFSKVIDDSKQREAVNSQ